MKLFIFAVAAMRTVDKAIGVRTAFGLLPADTNIEEAGQEVARGVFPVSDGWENHYAHGAEIPQELTLEPYQLTWDYKKVG